jgi:hypothetical protein
MLDEKLRFHAQHFRISGKKDIVRRSYMDPQANTDLQVKSENSSSMMLSLDKRSSKASKDLLATSSRPSCVRIDNTVKSRTAAHNAEWGPDLHSKPVHGLGRTRWAFNWPSQIGFITLRPQRSKFHMASIQV